jgi:sRNA-binding protein
MDTNSICQFILTHNLNADELGKISNAIKIKSSQLNTAKLFQLNIGDKVVFNNKVRPTYLIRQKATVLEVKRTRIKVQLDNAMGRFSSRPVMVPAELLDLVAAS